MSKQRSKIMKLCTALLLCMGFFIASVPVYAADADRHTAPPMVETEIIGSLLRIRTTSGFFAVEAVYINGRRFNHRVDSALVIDISQYIVTGNTIAIHAVDFAGNQSDTVLLTPPTPAQPPPPNNFTPDGQGEILDSMTDEDGIEFFTITTAAGNVFHLIIDHTRGNNNVFFLNAVTEWDLLTLAADADLVVPPHIAPPAPPPVIIEHEPPPAIEEEPDEPIPEPVAEESGGRMGTFIFLIVAGGAAFGVIYYLKILKPKREREMYGGGDGDYDDGDEFEDIDENDPINDEGE